MNKQMIAGIALGAFVATGLGTVYTAANAQTSNNISAQQGQGGQQGGRPGFGGQGGPGGGGFPGGQGGPGGGGFPGGQGGPGGGGFPGGQGGPGGGGFLGGQGGLGGGMMRGMMGGGMQPVVTATERYVYVLRGDTLFQYSAEGLKLIAKATLPQDDRQRGGGGFPGGPGGN